MSCMINPMRTRLVISTLVLTCGCLHARAVDIQVDADHPGGNVRVVNRAGNAFTLAPDLRDTQGWWFHFNFRLRAPVDEPVTMTVRGSQSPRRSRTGDEHGRRPHVDMDGKGRRAEIRRRRPNPLVISGAGARRREGGALCLRAGVSGIALAGMARGPQRTRRYRSPNSAAAARAAGSN